MFPSLSEPVFLAPQQPPDIGSVRDKNEHAQADS
jgi:hypothetical protein